MQKPTSMLIESRQAKTRQAKTRQTKTRQTKTRRLNQSTTAARQTKPRPWGCR